MKKKSLLFLVSVVALAVVMLVSGLVFYVLNVTMTATVETQGTVTVKIDNQTWENGTTIPWGTIHVGTNTLPIIITSNVNTVLTASITGVPTGSSWTIALSLNSTTVAPFDTASGNIVLTLPSNAVANTYSWSATLMVQS